MDATVPLWLGVMLRKRKLAKIVPPSWMDVEVLKEVARYERDPNEASFSPELPFRHAEIYRHAGREYNIIIANNIIVSYHHEYKKAEGRNIDRVWLPWCDEGIGFA